MGQAISSESLKWDLIHLDHAVLQISDVLANIPPPKLSTPLPDPSDFGHAGRRIRSPRPPAGIAQTPLRPLQRRPDEGVGDVEVKPAIGREKGGGEKPQWARRLLWHVARLWVTTLGYIVILRGSLDGGNTDLAFSTKSARGLLCAAMLLSCIVALGTLPFAAPDRTALSQPQTEPTAPHGTPFAASFYRQLPQPNVNPGTGTTSED